MTTAAAVGTISTLAAGPLVAAIFVGIATAVLLEKVDEHFGLTEALIKFIDKTYASIYDKTFGALARNIYELVENIDLAGSEQDSRSAKEYFIRYTAK